MYRKTGPIRGWIGTLITAFLYVALSARAQAQYTEIVWDEVKTWHIGETLPGGFTAPSDGYYDIDFSLQDHFGCTGDSSTVYPWRLRFQQLVSPQNTRWVDSYELKNLKANQTVTFKRDSYRISSPHGVNTFVPGQNGWSSATRNIDELVTSQLWYWIT